MAIGGELLAHDAVEGIKPYAAVCITQGPVGSEAHKVGVRHVDRRIEILLVQAKIVTAGRGGFQKAKQLIYRK